MPRLRSLAVAASLLSGLWLAGCSDSTTAPTVESATFASSLGIDLSTYTKTSGGLYYKDLVVPPAGATVANGQLVSVHYTGYFTNGKVFDSNPSTAAPFAFHLGQSEVIKGWDIGVAGMRVGGQRELIVPPSLGYGSSDYLSIPGNSILVFVVTVVSAK